VTTHRCSLLCHCSNCCPLLTWLLSPTVLTHLIWHLVSCSFPRIKFSHENVISRMYQKFRNNFWPSDMQFQEVSSRSACSSGRKNGPII
jgi:hypothetical protein